MHVLGRELPLETTSAVAAALWYPYRIDPVDRVLPWSVASLREFEPIAADDAVRRACCGAASSSCGDPSA